jgi:hypothetical protein
MMVDDLLDIRALLFETAETLYGPEWIMTSAFWGSTTERQLMENTYELSDMGYRFPEATDGEIKAAKDIAKKFGLGLDLEE